MQCKAVRIAVVFLAWASHVVDSAQIGFVRKSIVRTNTTVLSTNSSECADCLCNCMVDNGSCYGINCFPSTHRCQQIDQQWVQEADLQFDNSSDYFVIARDIHFCSCYSPQNILEQLANVTPTSIAHTAARFIKYNPYNDTLIVMGDALIAQYSVSSLSRIRSISSSSTPLALCLDSQNVYITFSGNLSVNKYDMNLRFLQSRQLSSSSSSSRLYGMVLWRNGLLISNDVNKLIWFVETSTMNAAIYLDVSRYGIEPFNIAVFNDELYISELSSADVYIYNTVSGSMRTLSLPSSTVLYRLTVDPFCHRLWYGTSANTYSSVPVIDLDRSQAQVYPAAGLLAQRKTFKVEFDASYSMYTVALNENYFYKYTLPSMACDRR